MLAFFIEWGKYINYKKSVGLYNCDETLLRYMVEVLALRGNEESEDEIIDFLHTIRGISREAENLGLYVTDQELDRKIHHMRSFLRYDYDAYSAISAFSAGAGISEDEYWRISASVFREELIADKLFTIVYERFLAENAGNDTLDDQEMFNLLQEYF